MKAKVAIVPCNDYESENLKQAIREGIKLLELDNSYFENKKALLKVNLLMPKNPDSGVTTNPELVNAVCNYVSSKQSTALIADSPGGPFNRTYLTSVYRATKMKAIADQGNAKLNYDFAYQKVSFPAGKTVKSFTIASFALNSDLLINMPKFKTHGLTRLTGAVKNLFGIIPGLLKVEYHLNMSEVKDFAGMLCDLAQCVPPHLNIVDGVIAMEGAGPSGGDLKATKCLLFGENAFAVDVVLAHMMGVDPLSVPTIAAAKDRGLCYQLADIEVLGAIPKFESFKVPDARKNSILIDRYLPRIAPFLKNILQPYPVFLKNCVGCGACERHCPPQVITESRLQKPKVNLKGCIRCFCCQELCPHNAVKIHKPFLTRVFLSR